MTVDNEDKAGTDREGCSVARHILELAGTVPAAQTLLDQQHARDFARFEVLAGQLGVAPDDPLFLFLIPSRLVLSRYEVGARFLFSSERRSDLEVGARLGGRLVNSFLELRYHTSEAYRDRLKITVEASPVSHRTPTRENHRG